jgi:cytochrome c-type biogenesis protein CcmH
MTLLWILLTAMCSAAAVLVAAPFLRRLDGGETALARDVEIYRDQLREVEREAADGLIDAEQAESASQEIKRRLLAADRSSEAAPAPESFGQRNFAIIAVAGIVVLGSTILYAINGRPDLPSVNRAPRVAVAETPSAPAMPAAARMSSPAPAPSKVAENQEPPASAQPTTLPSVDSMIERLAARLKAKPDDAEGWRTLGWSYTAMDRHADAVEAYAKAVALRPDMASYQAGYGEALVRAANGTLSLQAKVSFETALKLDPK